MAGSASEEDGSAADLSSELGEEHSSDTDRSIQVFLKVARSQEMLACRPSVPSQRALLIVNHPTSSFEEQSRSRRANTEQDLLQK